MYQYGYLHRRQQVQQQERQDEDKNTFQRFLTPVGLTQGISIEKRTVQTDTTVSKDPKVFQTCQIPYVTILHYVYEIILNESNFACDEFTYKLMDSDISNMKILYVTVHILST